MPTEPNPSATPLARRLAARLDLELAQLSGSGSDGRVTKADIEAVVSPQVNVPASQSAVPALVMLETPAHPQEPEFELQPLNNVRRTTARRLTEAKQTIPHFYLSTDCKVDQLLAFREDLGKDTEGRFRLSVNDLILKAVAIALCKVPEANASWTDVGIKQYRAVNLAVAVINPPQACILAFGKSERRPVAQGGSSENATLMNCTLSADHRVLDGTVAANFLSTVQRCLEEPLRMLL